MENIDSSLSPPPPFFIALDTRSREIVMAVGIIKNLHKNLLFCAAAQSDGERERGRGRLSHLQGGGREGGRRRFLTLPPLRERFFWLLCDLVVGGGESSNMGLSCGESPGRFVLWILSFLFFFSPFFFTPVARI